MDLFLLKMTRLGIEYGKMNSTENKTNSRFLAIHLAIGIVLFFIFFAAIFNGLDHLIYISGAAVLITNALVSYFISRKNKADGIKAALIFASPALLLTALSIGDAVANGNIKAFLFWSSYAVVSAIAGLVGVFVSHKIKK